MRVTGVSAAVFVGVLGVYQMLERLLWAYRLFAVGWLAVLLGGILGGVVYVRWFRGHWRSWLEGTLVGAVVLETYMFIHTTYVFTGMLSAEAGRNLFAYFSWSGFWGLVFYWGAYVVGWGLAVAGARKSGLFTRN